MKKKKVYFDSRWVGEHGIGRFAQEIENRNPDFIKINSKVKPSSPFDLIYTTLFVAFHKGLYFTPGYNSPLFFLKKCIITVHDLNHVDVDHNTSILKKIYYHFVLKNACKKARKIITVSEFSKKRICEWAKVEPSKVEVVGNGVSAEFHANVSPEPGKYFFMVGNRKKHKNEKKALEAFAEANLPTDVLLVMTGNPSEEIENTIKLNNLSSRVRFTGRVDNEKLASLYKGATALLFPSLYEGFGIPVIEAMACGTPVITSNTTSLPEVAGDAAILIDPTSKDDIRDAIEVINSNKILRDELVEKGYKNYKKYSWEYTNKKVCAVINEGR